MEYIIEKLEQYTAQKPDEAILFDDAHSKGITYAQLQDMRKRELRFCTLSKERVRASRSTGRGTPAPCLLRSCPATLSAGRSPAPTL